MMQLVKGLILMPACLGSGLIRLAFMLAGSQLGVVAKTASTSRLVAANKAESVSQMSKSVPKEITTSIQNLYRTFKNNTTTDYVPADKAITTMGVIHSSSHLHHPCQLGA